MQSSPLKPEQNSFGDNPREGVAESRMSFGQSSAAALRIALIKSGQANDILWGLDLRLRLCASRKNHWVGNDLHNTESGDLYDANGVQWACSCRLCPDYVAKIARRARKQLRTALANYWLLVGENYKFVTFTIPNPNLSYLKTRKLIYRAWAVDECLTTKMF